MIGELITGGLGLIGSLFGKKKEPKQRTTVDYQALAHEAQQGGFNPLTALRNGGSAGFTTTTSPSTSMLPEAMANLGGILGPALGNMLDPLAAKKRQLDTALVDYQLRNLKQGPQQPAGALYSGQQHIGTKTSAQISPTVGPSVNRVANVPAAYVPKKGANAPGEGTIVGGENPAVSTLGWNNGKYGLFHAPWMTDAETAETIYGDNEINSTLYSAGKYINDGAYSVYRNATQLEKDYGKEFRKKLPKAAKGLKGPAKSGRSMGGLYQRPAMSGGGW